MYKKIPWNPRYEVYPGTGPDDLAHVRHVDSGKILATHFNPRPPSTKDYRRVSMYVDALTRDKQYLSRLVMLVFRPPSDPDAVEAHHKDGVHTNDWLSNLEWRPVGHGWGNRHEVEVYEYDEAPF